MEHKEVKEQSRIEAMKQLHNAGKKNEGGAAYNVLSHGYDQNQNGQSLAQMDDDAKVRAAIRTNNLTNIGN